MIKVKNKNIKSKPANNRANFLLAVIFLSVGLVIWRLYGLQISDYDLYTALANSQHQVLSELEAERGKIFLSENESGEEKLYPLATNKEFALVYAVPKEIEEDKADEIAEYFYNTFDKEDLIEEKQEKINQEIEASFISEMAAAGITIMDWLEADRQQKYNEWMTADKIEYWTLKKDLEIEEGKKEIVNAYLEKLTKKNDPYEQLQRKVDEDTLADLESREYAGIKYVMETFRYYPEDEVGCHVLGYLDNDPDNPTGHYGLEGFFEDELSGTEGMMQVEKDGSGGLSIINDLIEEPAKDGSDLVLTIDRSIQFYTCKKLEEAIGTYAADSGSIIIMDPDTGAIMAMCAYPEYNPNDYTDVDDMSVYNNQSIFAQYEPGSIFKPITMAAALDLGKVMPETTYVDTGQVIIDDWPISNSDYSTYGAHGEVDMISVLENSLNTGAIFAAKAAGKENFAEYVKKFGFGEKTGIELETESAGNISNLEGSVIQDIYMATASFGQGITVTPIQMAAAYSAIANGGILMQPYIVKEIIGEDGFHNVTEAKQIRRVISERASSLLKGMLVKVVDGGHAIKAAVDGYYVAGKTGTAQVASSNTKGYSGKTIHSFVGFAPADDPEFVMIVKLDNVKNVAYSASSAAPVFGDIADFILSYLKVPKER